MGTRSKSSWNFVSAAIVSAVLFFFVHSASGFTTTDYEDRLNSTNSSWNYNNCTSDQEYRCQTYFPGNKCNINGSRYFCECDADGFEVDFYRQRCIRYVMQTTPGWNYTSCTWYQKERCEAYYPGNECNAVNGSDYYCTCNAFGFEEDIYGKNCIRYDNGTSWNSSCTSYQRDRCQAYYDGNVCRPVNGSDYICTCNGNGFISDFDRKRCIRYDVGTTPSWNYNCTSYQKDNCEAYYNRNECHVVNGSDYFCTCDEDGYHVDFYEKRCIQVNCSDYDKDRCRTDVANNTCYFTGRIAECACNAEGFLETDRRTRCQRMYCTSNENDLCEIYYGNDCRVYGDNHRCRCYNGFEAVDRETLCRQTNCSSYQRRECQSHWSNNKCHSNGTDFYCSCQEPGYNIADNGRQCIDYENSNCTSDQNYDCQTYFWGNECRRNGTNYYCRCDANGFEEDRYGQRCIRYDQRTTPSWNYTSNCTWYQNERCEAYYPGNECHAINGSDYYCTCNAFGFEEDFYRQKCIRYDWQTTPNWNSNCTYQAEYACQTDYWGNECVSNGTLYYCRCNANGFEEDRYGRRCNRYGVQTTPSWNYTSCTWYQKERCEAYYSGNECHAVNGSDYYCKCNAFGFEEDFYRQKCIRYDWQTTPSWNSNCTYREEYECRTDYWGNECKKNGTNYYCRCDANGFEEDRYGRRCIRYDQPITANITIQTNCNGFQRQRCQTYWNYPGNECDIVNGSDYYCKCYAFGFEEGIDGQSCRSNCTNFRDTYACKVHIEGNNCSINGGYRECRCNAPGYTAITVTNSSDTCWRTECTSYEEDECKTKVAGNKCEVVDDVFKCTCNAPGHVIETPKFQRCIGNSSLKIGNSNLEIDIKITNN